MEKLIREPLFYIFFVYGASFLLMFYLVMKGAMKATAGPLVFSFSLLALFGLTHGITEMVDWVRFILKTVGVGEVKVLTYLSQIFLIASFVILFQFGLNLLTYQFEKKSLIRTIPVILFAVFLAVTMSMGITDILRLGLLARYGFGFTGALLSAIAMFVAANTMKSLGNEKLVTGLNISAAGFACYAVFGGLITTPIAGIPVQLFRAACAVTIAVYAFSVLDVYKYVKSKSELAASWQSAR